MVLLLLFTLTITSRIVGISPTGMHLSTSTPWYSAVQDGSRIQEHIALRLFIYFEPYLVEQERMATAQLLMYGSKHLEQNFFFFFSKEV
jgi:hypothetical protein